MSTSSASSALSDLMDSGIRLGREMLGMLRSDPQSVLSDVGQRASDLLAAGRRQVGGCGCEIPDPCWMPKKLGTVTSHVCPGSTASVRLRITNCGLAPREVSVRAAGRDAKGVQIAAPTVAIEPFDQGVVTAKITVPDEDARDLEIMLWVRGCRDHLLYWTVSVSRHGCSCAHEIEVSDCPDLVHHWYDHFYCVRPCPHGDDHATHG